MADNDFEREMANIFLDNIEKLMDLMAEQVAKKIAHDVIEVTEDAVDEAHLVQRKPLIYLKIAEELQRHVDKMSGEVKVE